MHLMSAPPSRPTCTSASFEDLSAAALPQTYSCTMRGPDYHSSIRRSLEEDPLSSLPSARPRTDLSRHFPHLLKRALPENERILITQDRDFVSCRGMDPAQCLNFWTRDPCSASVWGRQIRNPTLQPSNAPQRALLSDTLGPLAEHGAAEAGYHRRAGLSAASHGCPSWQNQPYSRC